MIRRSTKTKRRSALKPRDPPAPELNSTRGRVFGLDVSSTTVGWCVFDGATVVAYGKFHPKGRPKCHGEKLASYARWLRGMLETHKPDEMVVEVPYSGRRRFTYGILMMYLGVGLQQYFEYFGCEMPATSRIMPHAVKRLLRVKKQLTYEQRKKQMVLFVNACHQLDLQYKAKDKGKVSDDDIADAIALVQAWLTRTKETVTDV